MKRIFIGGFLIAAMSLALVLSMAAGPVLAVNDGFKDVPETAWYHAYVMGLYERDIIKGYGTSGEFRPSNKLTREQTAKMISISRGLATEGLKANFSDVDPDGEMSPYIASLVLVGAIGGYPDGSFRPKNNIKRSHVSKIVALAFDLDMGEASVNLTDLPSDPVLADAIRVLASNGIVSGYKGTSLFKPDDEISRAEFSKIAFISMTIAAVQKAEKSGWPEAIAEARELVGILPDQYDKELKDALNARLDALAGEGDLVIANLVLEGLLEETAAPEFYYEFETQRDSVRITYDNPSENRVNQYLEGRSHPSWEFPLKEGDNTIEIRVASPDGQRETSYRFLITRTLASEAAIENLEIRGILDKILTPASSYSRTTDRVRSYFSFDNPYGAQVTAKFNGSRVNSGFPLRLLPGGNLLTIEVRSADGQASRSYEIQIERTGPSSRALLENLQIDMILEPVEEPERYYSLTTEVDKAGFFFDNPYGASLYLSVNGQEEEELPYTYIETDLSEGLNALVLRVESADESKETIYRFDITRTLSSEAKIRFLSLDPLVSRSIPDPAERYSFDTDYAYVSLYYANPYGADIRSFLKGQEIDIADDLRMEAGVNEIEIRVVSADGQAEFSYFITVNRNENLPALIEDLNISSWDDSVLHPETYYQIELDSDYFHFWFTNPYGAEIHITMDGGMVEGSRSDDLYQYGQFYPFPQGQHRIEIHVLAKGGASNLYVLDVNRPAETRAEITYFELAGIGAWEELTEDLYQVTAEVGETYLTYSNPYNCTVSILFNGQPLGMYEYAYLDEEINTFVISILSEDGQQSRTQTIEVTRTASGTAEIRGLYIYGVMDQVIWEPEFHYTFETDRSSVYLSYSNPYNAQVSLSVNGSPVSFYEGLNLVTGLNRILIDVTSEDGVNSRQYLIEISRTESDRTVLAHLFLHGLLDDQEEADIFYQLETDRVYTILSYGNPYNADISVRFNGQPCEMSRLVFVTGVTNILEILVISESGEDQELYRIEIKSLVSSRAEIEGLLIFGMLDYEEYPDDYYQIQTGDATAELYFDNPFGAEVTVSFNGLAVSEWYQLDLLPGENTIHIDLLSADQSTSRRYTIRIDRVSEAGSIPHQ